MKKVRGVDRISQRKSLSGSIKDIRRTFVSLQRKATFCPCEGRTRKMSTLGVSPLAMAVSTVASVFGKGIPAFHRCNTGAGETESRMSGTIAGGNAAHFRAVDPPNFYSPVSRRDCPTWSSGTRNRRAAYYEAILFHNTAKQCRLPILRARRMLLHGNIVGASRTIDLNLNERRSRASEYVVYSSYTYSSVP